MKVFSKDILRNPQKLSLILILSLSCFVVVAAISFLVWNELSPEGQEEFEHSTTIYYY